ncbi:hypothetical protein FisN_14Hh350 [Fistulifera solaris]|jgi:hypothetical protein|uniref:Uncharacterized protein n=1 Tax=Fistulifera solaris TaxID=1519565 RepID=A0A1Z5KB28_FISSO|nr:hypothetical protein FisN_14Hh350 [Fistulifera solaris]|eukprot:GAX23480.1 hypothetical protein FisN_14Hh350 [Fistulifera solaris]
MGTEDVQFRYTAAIALNNVGASLLARRCYDEALEAFTDATAIMHDASMCDPHLSLEAINGTLEKSYHELSHCKPETKNNGFVRFRVITENDFADTLKTGFNESDDSEASSQLSLNVIRIELSETTIREGMAYFRGTERSILLNNLAASYICVATTSALSHVAERYLALAYQMLQLACSNLESVCQYSCINGQKDELRTRILPFTLLILQALDRLAPALRIPYDAFEHYTTVFLDVLEEFLEVDDMYSSCLRSTAAAA